MKFLIILILLSACSTQKDYSYLNTDRRGCKTFIHVSKRFSIKWDSLTTIKWGIEEHCDTNVVVFKKLRDTIFWDPATCPPPDLSMPDFRREIRYYEEIIKPNL